MRAELRHLEAFLAVLQADRAIESGPAYRFPDRLPHVANVTRITRSDVHLLRLMAWDLAETLREFERREPFVSIKADTTASRR